MLTWPGDEAKEGCGYRSKSYLGTSLSRAEPAALDCDPGGWGNGSHVAFSPCRTAGL